LKKWKGWKITIIVLSSILLIILGYTFYLYHEVRATFDAIHEPINLPSKTEDVSISKPNETSLNQQPPPQQNEEDTAAAKPITVLLLGIDNMESTTGRSDTILLLTLNPAKETMKILSIPRDTYTEIVGFNFEDKINHSYAFGGIETTLLTVENLMNVPIDYVVSVNMEGFIELVDIIGGIEVENDMDFTQDSYHFSEGKITLSGDAALNFVRMRKEDPRGDFGRQMRQREVLESIFNKAVSFNLVWQAPSLLKSIREHVQTNLTFDEMIEFQGIYKSTLNNIDHFTFSHGDGHLQNGIWYYFLDDGELQEMRKTFQESLL